VPWLIYNLFADTKSSYTAICYCSWLFVSLLKDRDGVIISTSTVENVVLLFPQVR